MLGSSSDPWFFERQSTGHEPRFFLPAIPGPYPFSVLSSAAMDDQTAILTAITEYREAFKTADVDRLMSIFAPSFIDVVIKNDVAYDFGWHILTLTPKSGGDPIKSRQRYFELWARQSDGSWK